MKRFQNLLLITGVILLLVVPFLTVQKSEPLTDREEVEIFAGADTMAEEMITKINPDYKPWFNPLIEPASGEVESFLFALQAAFGAGFIGYYFGLVKGRK